MRALRTARGMARMMRYAFKARMMYPSSYYPFLFAKLLNYASDYAIIILLVSRFETIAGWTLPELLFLHGLQVLSYTVAGQFFMGLVNHIDEYVAHGGMDAVLTKPMPPLVWLSGKHFSATYLSQVVLGAVVIAWSVARLGITPSAGNVALLLAIIAGSVLLQGALFVVIAGVSVWTLRGRTIADTIMSFRYFIEYPVSIYGTPIRLILTFVVPVAFINYYPAGLLLTRAEYAAFRPLVALAPVVGATLFAGSLALWRVALRGYNSSGT